MTVFFDRSDYKSSQSHSVKSAKSLRACLWVWLSTQVPLDRVESRTTRKHRNRCIEVFFVARQRLVATCMFAAVAWRHSVMLVVYLYKVYGDFVLSKVCESGTKPRCRYTSTCCVQQNDMKRPSWYRVWPYGKKEEGQKVIFGTARFSV